MKRRDFVRAAVSLPVLSDLESSFSESVNFFEEENVLHNHSSNEDYNLHFMAIGDWGRNGEYLQSELADQMGAWAASNRTHFVISTGDNFYPKGVVSDRDPLWHYSFENVYRAHSLQCDWYPVLGNHDYGADPDAQVKYSDVSRRWKMPARYYSKDISMGKDKGRLLLIMLDTNSFVDSRRDDESRAQLGWLEETLAQASSDTRWKIVVGHHPAYTVGPRIEHRQVFVMRKALTEIFNRQGVDLYISGHEHSLQHLKPEGFVHQVVSGAGSELTPVTAGVSHSKFEASVNGFLYASLNSERLNMKMVDYSGKLLYDTTLKK